MGGGGSAAGGVGGWFGVHLVWKSPPRFSPLPFASPSRRLTVLFSLLLHAGHGGEVASRPSRGGVRGGHPLRDPLAVRAKRGRRPRLALVFSQTLRLRKSETLAYPVEHDQSDLRNLESNVPPVGGMGAYTSEL